MTRRTRSWSQRLLMAFAILLTLGVCGFTYFAIMTDNAREAAIAKVTPSPAIERYKAWTQQAPLPDNPDHVETDVPRPACFEAFAKACEGYKKLAGKDTDWDKFMEKTYLVAPWADGPELETAKKLCDSSRDYLAEIRAIAAAGGPLYPLNFDHGFAIELPHLSETRGMGRLLYVDAVSQARSGASDEALEDILSIMRLGDALSQEPIIISQLARIALYDMAYDALTMAFSPGELTPGQANRVITQVRQGLHRQELSDAFKGEIHAVTVMYEQIRNGGGADVLVIRQDDGWNRVLANVITSDLARPWLNMDETACIEVMDRLADLAKEPYYEAADGISALERQIEGLPFTRVMTRSMTTSLSGVFQTLARHEARLGLIEVGLLAEQQAAASGAAPASLAFAGSAAIDPCTGEPFVYRPNGAVYVLYSVGVDQKDDGGVEKVEGDWREGDFVWRGK